MVRGPGDGPGPHDWAEALLPAQPSAPAYPPAAQHQAGALVARTEGARSDEAASGSWPGGDPAEAHLAARPVDGEEWGGGGSVPMGLAESEEGAGEAGGQWSREELEDLYWKFLVLRARTHTHTRTRATGARTRTRRPTHASTHARTLSP